MREDMQEKNHTHVNFVKRYLHVKMSEDSHETKQNVIGNQMKKKKEN